MKRFYALLLVFVLCFSLVVPQHASAAVKISKTRATIQDGSTLQLTMGGVSNAVKWSTSNSKVATVSQAGLVRAKSTGTVQITAKVNSRKYTCKITVIPYVYLDTEYLQGSIYIGYDVMSNIINYCGESYKMVSKPYYDEDNDITYLPFEQLASLMGWSYNLRGNTIALDYDGFSGTYTINSNTYYYKSDSFPKGITEKDNGAPIKMVNNIIMINIDHINYGSIFWACHSSLTRSGKRTGYFYKYASNAESTTPTPTATPAPTATPISEVGNSEDEYFTNVQNAVSKSLAIEPLKRNEFIKTLRDYSTDSWYKVNLNEGEGISVGLKAQIDSGYMYLYLYNEDGHLLDSSYASNGKYATCDYKAISNCTVYAKVSGSKGIYYIGFYDNYYNNSSSQSDIRDFFGSQYIAKTLYNGEVIRADANLYDWYRIDVDEGQTLSVNITPQIDSGYFYLYLFDADGHILTSQYASNAQVRTITKKASMDGTYFIKVYGPKGKYSISYSLY